MAKYELMYIVDGALEAEANQAVHDKVKAIVEKNATITSEEHIGRKRFAYEIDHKNEGDYMLFKLETEKSAPEEINSDLRITEGLVRHILFALD